jgi:hypothetical protein
LLRAEKILKRYAVIYKKFTINGSFALESPTLRQYFREKWETAFAVTMYQPFKLEMVSKYSVRYSDSSITKNYSIGFLEKIKIMYLRKSKMFNKSRFSRNRQLYRTGVYWCLWINIVIVYALYFYFYRFSFTFGYFWYIIGFFFFSFFFGRGLQIGFFKRNGIKNEIINFYRWSSFLVSYLFMAYTWSNYFTKRQMKFLFYTTFKKTQNFFDEFWVFVYKRLFWFSLEWSKDKKARFIYFFRPFPGVDTSFLKWRSKAHWLMELCIMLITH